MTTILSIKKTVTSSQLLNLSATPVNIIPPCGAGQVIQILQYVANYIAGSTPYTTNIGENLTLVPTGTSDPWIFSFPDTGFFDQHTNQIDMESTIPAFLFPTSDLLMNGVDLANIGIADLTTGNGSLILTVFYQIIPAF